ncbi:MAG: V-type ATP synthase subunit F [Methanomassiliicoccales archaeon]|nr:V-type ATP synthase subunit F [Methanomassiliicoccales archaeon]
MEIAVLGNEEFVLGFRLAGVKRVFLAEEGDFEERVLEILEDSAIGVLAIKSSSLESVSATVRKKALDSISPVVVAVGGEEGDLREKVKRAIGVDLYKTESE